jgi:uncharacterized membrane protein
VILGITTGKDRITEANTSRAIVLGRTMIIIMATGGMIGIQATNGMEERRKTTFAVIRTIMVSDTVCTFVYFHLRNLLINVQLEPTGYKWKGGHRSLEKTVEDNVKHP